MSDLLDGRSGSMPSNVLGFNTQGPIRKTELDALFVDQFMPRHYELARNVKIFSATLAVAGAVAPLQVVPTTTALFVLNNVTAGINVVPLAIGVAVGSGTADTGAAVYAQCGSTPLATQLTANGSNVVISNSAGSNTSAAFGDVSKTVAGGWALIGGMNNAAVTTPGASVVIDVGGMFVIRPTYALGVHVLSGAGTTAKFIVGVTWAEVPGTMGS